MDYMFIIRGGNMEKVGFVGAFDKTDLLIYIAKILTVLGKRVLIADATITQKAKYVVPALNPTLSYITEFEEIYISVYLKLKSYFACLLLWYNEHIVHYIFFYF